MCEGIAKATKLLFNAVDMGCIVVAGKSKGSNEHAWNVVKVAGDAYHLDMTWDIANSRKNQICYDYYNLPEKAILLDHSDFAGIPLCTAWKENYFFKNGCLLENQNQLERHLNQEIAKGKQDLYFRLKRIKSGSMQNTVQMSQSYVAEKLSKESDVRWKVKAIFNEEQNIGRIVMFEDAR